MNSYERAGRLLVLAAELREREDARSATAVERTANLAATVSTDAAFGFIEGWWYVTGNTQPLSNYAWRNARELLGEPVR